MSYTKTAYNMGVHAAQDQFTKVGFAEVAGYMTAPEGKKLHGTLRGLGFGLLGSAGLSMPAAALTHLITRNPQAASLAGRIGGFGGALGGGVYGGMTTPERTLMEKLKDMVD